MSKEARLFFLIILFITILIFIQFNPIASRKSVQTKVLKLPEINQMDINIPYNVYLVEGETNSMVIEGPEDLIEKISVVMDDTTLNIHRKGNQWLEDLIHIIWVPESKINVYVTVKDLSEVKIKSRGKFSFQRAKEDSPIGWMIGYPMNRNKISEIYI